jgi:predicted RNA-binding protein Jag
MEKFQTQVKKIFELAGFEEPVVNLDHENRKIDIFVNEGEWFKKWLPSVVSNVDHLVKLLTRKENADNFFVDINNYRKERGRIIVELAKAAAKKALILNGNIKLPIMNAYERRLVHIELAIHPEVETESEGEGRDRCVVIKPIA